MSGVPELGREPSAVELGGALLDDLVELLDVCIARHRGGADPAGHQRLGELVATFIRTLRHAGYSTEQIEQELFERFAVELNKPG